MVDEGTLTVEGFITIVLANVGEDTISWKILVNRGLANGVGLVAKGTTKEGANRVMGGLWGVTRNLCRSINMWRNAKWPL